MNTMMKLAGAGIALIAIARLASAKRTPSGDYAAADGSTPVGTAVCIISSTADPLTQRYNINEAGTIIAWLGTFYVAATVIGNVGWWCYPTELKLGAC